MVAFDTTFPADSLEFCPTIGYQDIVVCGTYNLLEKPPSQSASERVRSKAAQTRHGQCLVFRTSPREDYRLYGRLPYISRMLIFFYQASDPSF